MIYVYCGRKSRSAARLVEEIANLTNGNCLRKRESEPGRRWDGPVINWGCSTDGWVPNCGQRVLNPPHLIHNSVNKLRCFKLLSRAGVPTLESTVNRQEAQRWLDSGSIVFGRMDELQEGNGITVYTPDLNSTRRGGAIQNNHDFYTRNYEKTHEFRVYVVNGVAIDFVEKKRLNDRPEASLLVRSWNEGWIFAHENLRISRDADRRALEVAATNAVRACSLDFGAVDILTQLRPGRPGRFELLDFKVCEVNSAPGIDTSRVTLEAHAAAFARLEQGA